MNYMVEILMGSLISCLPDLLHTEVDGEAVLVSVDSGKYYGMDEVGTEIWNRIQEPCKVADLIGLMKNEYEDESGAIELDVLAFLSQLADEKLIEVK